METSRTLNRAITRTLQPSARQRAREAIAVVTPMAWGAGVLGLVAIGVGRHEGWKELTVIGLTLLVMLVLSIGFTLGRSQLAVQVEVKPGRVRAGQRSAALVTVSNPTGHRILPVGMELTVGAGVAEFGVPSLAAGAEHEEVFILPTVRRAIIPVGPATSVRSDPLGLLRRTQSWTEVEVLFVHPFTVPLLELGTGFVRDLEGQPTADVSDADVAFHTLREYQPGDDRRFVHWLTSARVGTLMVRQFVDTRRSHVAVVVDGAPTSYDDLDDFELAVSAAASLGLRVLRDEQDLSVVVSGDRVASGAGVSLLDGLSAVEADEGRGSLANDVEHLFRFAGGISLGVIVTGRRATLSDIRGAALRFPPDVRVLVLQVDPGADAAVRPIGAATLLTMGTLDHLAELLWRAAS